MQIGGIPERIPYGGKGFPMTGKLASQPSVTIAGDTAALAMSARNIPRVFGVAVVMTSALRCWAPRSTFRPPLLIHVPTARWC